MENFIEIGKQRIAKIISQKVLTPEKLLATIEDSVSNASEIVKNVKGKVSPDFFASRNLVNIVGSYMK